MNPLARKQRKAFQQLKQRSLISHQQPKSPIAEQFRTIRSNIQFAAVDRELHFLTVTSAGPGEGKSTVSANLAVVMAQQGRSVLLVDTDLRKPTVHYTFRQTNTTGLTNVLTKQATLKEAVMPTEVDHLDVLTSGPIPPNPSELLDSKAMELFMEETRNQYDLIILDSPPVLAVTDAQILANRCDGTILVLSSGKTEVEQAERAKELLEKSSAKIIGTVLNRKPAKQSHYYYYYGRS